MDKETFKIPYWNAATKVAFPWYSLNRFGIKSGKIVLITKKKLVLKQSGHPQHGMEGHEQFSELERAPSEHSIELRKQYHSKDTKNYF